MHDQNYGITNMLIENGKIGSSGLEFPPILQAKKITALYTYIYQKWRSDFILNSKQYTYCQASINISSNFYYLFGSNYLASSAKRVIFFSTAHSKHEHIAMWLFHQSSSLPLISLPLYVPRNYGKWGLAFTVSLYNYLMRYPSVIIR